MATGGKHPLSVAQSAAPPPQTCVTPVPREEKAGFATGERENSQNKLGFQVVKSYVCTHQNIFSVFPNVLAALMRKR